MNLTAFPFFNLSTLAAAVLCVTSFANVALGSDIALAVRGVAPEYAIVVPTNAHPAVQYAAEELRDFTERMTGVRLPIATNVATAKAIILESLEGLEDRLNAADGRVADAFRLHVEGERLHVAGGGPRGVLYGVYELLERFGGCRWYSSWCSKIPARDALAVPEDLDDTQIPAFEMRDPGWFDVLAHPAFAARLRVNDRFWNWQLEEKYGGNPYRWAPGLGGHTFKRLLPPGTYFEKHPEYFSLVDGARRKDGQICLTNPEVLEIVTSNLLARIRRDPGAKFYSVSQDDNWHRCQCDGCKAVEKEEESASGPIIRFVNAIAEKVEKEFPNALIHTFAYNYSTKPPAKTKPHKNVVVQLCTDACEHARPIRGNAHGGTAAFQRNLEGWAILTDKLFIWDYTTDFRLYTLPWPNVLSLQDNLRLFRENGVKMVFAQGDNLGRHADWAELKAWLLAKWMWNPDLPMEGLLEDFFQGYYGAAAPYVRRYFDEIHRRIMTPAPNGTPRTLGMYDPDASQAIDADFLAEAAELFRKAEESVRDDQLAAYNVRMTAFPPDQLRFDRQYKVVDLSDADGACAGLSNAQALARSLFARRAEAKNLRLVEADGRDAEHTNRWAEVLARKTPLNGGGAYGEVEDWALELRYGGRRVSDPKAADGKAIMIFGNHSEWSVYFQMRFAAFKPNAKYRLRVRLRAETIGDGEAFSAGVHRGGPCVAKRTSEVSGDYAWYDVAVWKPDAGQCLWIAPGRFKNGKSAIKALYIDKIDFALADEPEPIKWSGGAWDETGAPAPDMDIYLTPSFWMGKAFAPIERVITDLGGFYTDCVGVSVPYRSIAESAEGRRMLWSAKRHVNAQYAHPAHRAGRSLSWSSFLYGFDGYAWWCYCWDATGTPWDIRTWTDFDYEAVTVFPLENDVAITAIYEEMREAWEDWRLLSLLRATGKATVLDALLREFAGSFDPPNMENAKPYACDFQSLRDRALAAFGTDQ